MSEELKSEYIDKAVLLNNEGDYSTTMQTIIELSKKIKELEERLLKLEEVRT